MNGPLIVATAAFLLVLLQFNNAHAAGPYEGGWTGTAKSLDGGCRRATMKLTVKDEVLSGQARLKRDTPKINGTVGKDGTVGATIGFQPFRGQFIRDRFEGTFKTFDCEWKALLRRTR